MIVNFPYSGDMKIVKVVAAVLHQNNKIFITQRGYGEWKNYWEFPGGKVEEGESEEEALKREIKEELGAEIVLEKDLGYLEYDYPSFHLQMRCYLATFSSDYVLNEAEDAKWIFLSEYPSYLFLPADISLFPKIEEALKETASHSEQR